MERDQHISPDDLQALQNQLVAELNLSETPALKITSALEETRLQFNALVPVIATRGSLLGQQTYRFEASYWVRDQRWEIEDVQVSEAGAP